ncbi:DUF2141 domain-containing protein [Citromicrobium bathyomarinum]|uniref:DUF2141 domain-containing protein n=1 Tax=Citromicrobium sp. WPS32 TaxID=1634517 RepID=UPI000A405C9F|nr:DUF2141 domain-containing protein [Citromicrobium sp. WPS32]|tara:strand:+ start:203 stop:721 length:519 start_codon:yes stop_codon:yes gene_type:complete
MRFSPVSLAARAAFAAAAGSLALSPVAAQQVTYAKVIYNDLSKCSSGAGPAIRITVTGLRSNEGGLYVRTFRARGSEWLRSQRYLTRLEAKPRKGTMTVCVPVDNAGDYALTVHHDVNDNRKSDLSVDGGGISNNPEVKTLLGIPLPPSLSSARFTVGSGVTNLRIDMRYKD